MKKTYSNYIFDLDRTLYPYASDILLQVDEKIADFCGSLCNVDKEQGHIIRKKYYEEYGATLTGLLKKYSVDPNDYLDYVHAVDYSSLSPCHDLLEVLSLLNARKIIYTNGTKKHALNVLKQRKIDHLFSEIYDIQASNLIAKPCPEAFEIFLTKFSIDPSQSIFFDDNPLNTKTAKKFGVYSVLVLEGEQAKHGDHDSNFSDETIYSLSHYLKSIQFSMS